MGTFDLKYFKRIWVDRFNSQLTIEYYETKHISKETYRIPIEQKVVERLAETEYQHKKGATRRSSHQ